MGRSSMAVLGTLTPTTRSVAALRAPVRTCPVQQAQPDRQRALPCPVPALLAAPAAPMAQVPQVPLPSEEPLQQRLCSKSSKPFT